MIIVGSALSFFASHSQSLSNTQWHARIHNNENIFPFLDVRTFIQYLFSTSDHFDLFSSWPPHSFDSFFAPLLLDK